MVTTQFIGRLGNSMFQIAACIGYAKKYGYKYAFPTFDLRSNKPLESAIWNVFPNLPQTNTAQKRYNEHQPGHDHDWFNYHDIPDVGPDVCLFGFWQSWKYFENAKEEVRKIFELPKWNEYEDYIAIHVRRGDYVTNAGSFPPVTMDYINQAIEHFPYDSKFIVMSDDIRWCMQNMKGYDFEFSERNERQDLEIMTSCKSHIIANSTFSWWGAYLSNSRTVISPSCENGNWFGPTGGVKHAVVDLLPPEWIQIKFR